MTTGGRGVRLTVRNGVTAIVMVAAVGLAGCGSPTPVPTPATAAASPAASASPMADAPPSPAAIPPPEKPAEMNRGDEVGAVAAARYFMESYAYALASGDLTEWDRFSGQTCEFCANVHEKVSVAYQNEGRYLGSELLGMDEIKVAGMDEQLVVYGVQVRYSFARGSVVDGNGAEVRSFAAEDGYVILDVAPSERGWILMEGDGQDGPVS